MTTFNGLEYSPHFEVRKSAIVKICAGVVMKYLSDRYDKGTRTVRVQSNMLVNYISLER